LGGAIDTKRGESVVVVTVNVVDPVEVVTEESEGEGGDEREGVCSF
jgi:hypothetical protein